MDLLLDIKAMLQSKMENTKVAIHFSIDTKPLRIQSDPHGLRQVLLNVLINAIDASPPGSEVVLRIIRGENNRSIIIQVDDSGQGLGEKESDDLFQPFITTKARGTGLGLAVSRQIVEGLQGNLTLENNPQGGARCSIRLPLQE
jgi:signal transduction histidine kinase